MRLRGIATVVAAVTVSLVAASGAHATPTSDPIDWQPCEDAPEVDCASITVPVDWTDPDNTETIEIGLARHRATGGESSGSVVINPGGPGGSGVDMIKYGAYLVSDEIAAQYDVIGFDPRGINTSEPIQCDEKLFEEFASMPYPETLREYKAVQRLNGELAADCSERTGALFDHVDTIQTAHDIEAIRVALDDGGLNYAGYSYGTLMGQQYAELFGDNIRSMVLDGNMDHSLTTAWEFMSTETAAAEKNFVAFADWCDADTSCALNGDDTKATYGDLRERARSGDLTDPNTGEAVDFYQLTGLTFSYSSNPSQWSELAAGLRDLRDQSDTRTLSAALSDEVEINYPGQAIWCQDWNYPIYGYGHWALLNLGLALEYPNMQWTPYNQHALSCIGSGIETTNPQQPLQIDDDVDLVMIGNHYDIATVYPWSVSAAEQSGATLITYEGFGHTVYGQGLECIDGPVDSYIMDGVNPEEGISCPDARVSTG
ncbi:TAP-like protein [Stackebrandtia endophytica]|uniref:TAP-like protein n=1 Tax=Stackebrandtia endophytica TaxID=1496996 RepID=A0A543B3U3_9ACTN|nr:alpha/beta fold hydrolase [Stackebrandtia endophytica]TQL79506.1 TAP-like protein [Stackebrandtia endophytica]